MNNSNKEILRGHVEDCINQMFIKVSTFYHLDDGDLALDREIELEKIKEKLVKLLVNYVESNMKEN